MAVFTSVQSGDFDADATWDVGSGFPGSSDTFVIEATHVVTVPVGLTANSGGTVQGTSSSNRGSLIVAGDLTLSSNITFNAYNIFQLNAGRTLDLNGNDFIYTSQLLGRNTFSVNGTISSRAKIESTVAGGEIIGGGVESIFGEINLTYCDFTDCGRIMLGSISAAGEAFRMQWATFTGCGEARLGGWRRGDNDFILENIDFRASTSLTVNVAVIKTRELGGASGATGSIKCITAEANGTINTLRWETDLIDRDTIVTDGLLNRYSSAADSNVINSFVHYGTLLNDSSNDDYTDTYLYTEANNPHTNSGAELLISGSVIEATYLDGFSDDGDHFIVSNTNSEINTTLILETHSGVLMNALGGAKTGTYECNNNTLVGNYDNAYGSLARNESGGTFAGTFNLVDNLTVSISGDANVLGFNLGAIGDDQVTMMDYNAWVDIDIPYSGVTSATKTPGVTVGYGANDFNGIDPEFVDPTRSLAKWGLDQVGIDTAAAAIAHLMKMNGYDAASKSQLVSEESGVIPLDLLAWVRDGFAPTNLAYQGTSSTGGDVGAIAVVEVSGGISLTSDLTGSLTGNLTGNLTG